MTTILFFNTKNNVHKTCVFYQHDSHRWCVYLHFSLWTLFLFSYAHAYSTTTTTNHTRRMSLIKTDIRTRVTAIKLFYFAVVFSVF